MQVDFIHPVSTVHYTERINYTYMRNRIRELRESRGWTLEQLSEKMDCSLPQLQKMEKGERRLNDKWMTILCDIFKCKPGDIYFSSGQPSIYKADEKLMEEAAIAVVTSAQASGYKLTLTQAMSYTVELYNQAMDYRSQGKTAEISEFTAALVLKKHNQ